MSQDLQDISNLIRNETVDGGNTKERVASAFDIVNTDKLDSGGSTKTGQDLVREKTSRGEVLNLSQLKNNFSFTSRDDARTQVEYDYRGIGQQLFYQLASGKWVKELYIGSTTNISDWRENNNWTDIGVNRNELFNITQQTGSTYHAKEVARREVHFSNRGFGSIISYQMTDGSWITERYKGNSLDQNVWEIENNWEDVSVGAMPTYNASMKSNNYSFATKQEARASIEFRNRVLGQIITYQLSNGSWITEKYKGNTTNLVDWEKDFNWFSIPDSSMVATTLGDDNNKLVSLALLTDVTENKSYRNERSFLYTNTNQSVISCVSVNGIIYDIYSRANDYIYISSEGSLVASIKQSLVIGTLASCCHNGKIHIIASNANAYVNTNNLVNYYTFDILTKELVFVGSLNFGADRRVCRSIIVFKDKIYAAISYVSTNGVFYNSKAIVELYEVGEMFVKVSDIASPSDIWGYKFTVSGTDYYSLTQTGYYNATLSSDGDNLYCTYIGTPLSTAYTSKYLVFTKKSSDGVSWLKDEIHSNLRAYTSYLVHYKGEKIYFSKTYKSNDFAYNNTELNFSLNGIFNKGYYGILPILESKYGKTSNEYFYIYDAGDRVIITTSHAFADGRNARADFRFSLSKKEIYETLKGANFKDKGLLPSLVSDVNIGDSYLLDKQGTSNIPIWSFPYIGAVEKEYATNGKNGKIRLTYNGSELGWTPTYLQTPQSRIDTHVFRHGAQFNPFFSGYFRIPALADSEDENILYAAVDVRYTRGEDFDITQVGFCRSFNNGLTWQDYKIIFKRDEYGDPANRIHDCVMVVDKNPSSSHYGRIWAFAKMFTTGIEGIMNWDGERYVKLFVSYSDDKGLTWSEQEDITSIIPNEWLSIALGCNTGLTLKNGTLIIPFYVSKLIGASIVEQSTFLYSSDNGTTWQLGDITNTPYRVNESSIVELEDGSLIMNARDANNKIRRVFKLDSIGSGWMYKPEYSIIESIICHESLVYNRGVYLYSQPDPKQSVRRNITIWKSKDMINWDRLIQITDYPSGGYSNLIFTDNRLGILFEGKNSDVDYANLDYLLPIVYVPGDYIHLSISQADYNSLAVKDPNTIYYVY
ncbi:MAG: exo-alpha-sialidase [Dysgonomonas mossii]|uniref:sialidase family protein n=1 Tax=Dysgonomonas mossii TaxID=163665 RepID=UPI0026EE3353|nr:sialidase family protein [Dysgonomonas mossii]MBS5908715.1 exo-alpha-sialidase [Dysgonomonas mossii]